MSGKVGPVKPVNPTSWVAVVTPTDRPKSVRNRCLIELFVALFVFSLCPFDISVGVGAFVIGLSQISSFLSLELVWLLINVMVDDISVICVTVHTYAGHSIDRYGSFLFHRYTEHGTSFLRSFRETGSFGRIVGLKLWPNDQRNKPTSNSYSFSSNIVTFWHVSFWLHGCCGEWEGCARWPVNHTSWVAVVTSTDRPKSVRNRCVIELFVALFVLSLCPFDISVGVGFFWHRTESDLFLFLSKKNRIHAYFSKDVWRYNRTKCQVTSKQVKIVTQYSILLRQQNNSQAKHDRTWADLKASFPQAVGHCTHNYLHIEKVYEGCTKSS